MILSFIRIVGEIDIFGETFSAVFLYIVNLFGFYTISYLEFIIKSCLTGVLWKVYVDLRLFLSHND